MCCPPRLPVISVLFHLLLSTKALQTSFDLGRLPPFVRTTLPKPIANRNGLHLSAGHSTTALHSTEVKAAISTVSVCTGNLCRCQEEGRSADDILAALSASNVPYPVEETVCLGQCGPEAVVAIDYEDGTNSVMFGIEETLEGLGIIQSEKFIISATKAVTTKTKSTILIEDPRDRMRAEAELNGPPTVNPWMNAASYLAEKATKKLFG